MFSCVTDRPQIYTWAIFTLEGSVSYDVYCRIYCRKHFHFRVSLGVMRDWRSVRVWIRVSFVNRRHAKRNLSQQKYHAYFNMCTFSGVLCTLEHWVYLCSFRWSQCHSCSKIKNDWFQSLMTWKAIAFTKDYFGILQLSGWGYPHNIYSNSPKITRNVGFSPRYYRFSPNYRHAHAICSRSWIVWTA